MSLNLSKVLYGVTACVVAYFRRNELLSGVLERSGID